MTEHPIGPADGLNRIWTPHRMSYIAGEGGVDRHKPEGCPFCAMREARPGDLVVHRGETTFAVLNLHPYNPGHLMVLPYRHIGNLEELTLEETSELMELTIHAIQVLKRVSDPSAFNVGLNLGPAAGGSLSHHLHQHVVPRWAGDANFITVIGQTKTLPQLLEDTAELLADAWHA